MALDHLGRDDHLVPLLERAKDGDRHALGELFEIYRERLQRTGVLRLDRRLQGRCDASDILQEAYLKALDRFPKDYLQSEMASFLWVRRITMQTLIDLQRHHLGAQMRSVAQEVSLSRRPLPLASSASMAA